jgi:chromosome partitioning protein
VAEVVACANQKGGVGKTTTVVSVAAYLALDGRRVLVVDMDPQGNATSGLGVDRAAAGRSVYEALTTDVPIVEVTRPTAIDGLGVAPSSRDLAGAEVELVGLPGRERRLQRALRDAVDRYDFVLLDCPPSLGLLTVNALTAADSVLVPLQCEYYALEGLTQLMATIELVRAHLNPRLRLKAVLLTMVDARTSLSADVAAEARRHLGASVLETTVPRSVRLAEAPSYGRPIPLYSPASRGAEAYRHATMELLERSGMSAGPALTAAVPGPREPAQVPAWATR